MRRILILTLVYFCSQTALATKDLDVSKLVKLGAQVTTIAGKQYLAVTFENERKWHTYWKNPGDAGLPIKLSMKLGENDFNPTPLEWPAPVRFIEEGDIVTFGYEGKYAHFYQLSEQNIKELTQKDLTINGRWLVCKDVCVPGRASITGKLQNNQLAMSSPVKWSSSDLEKQFDELPRPGKLSSNFEYYLTRVPEKAELTFHYQLKNVGNLSPSQGKNVLTPFKVDPFGFKHETIINKDGTLYGKIEIAWDGEYSDPPQDLPKKGKFSPTKKLKFIFANPVNKKSEVIEVPVSNFSLETKATKEFYQKLEKKKPNLAAKQSIIPIKGNLFIYILFAFIGGLILNLMPCVLPVISIKLFSLLNQTKVSKKEIFRRNTFYALGVISTFLVLAIIVVLLKSAGTQVGWGFQLQSAPFVAVMITLLFVMALNLFGLFEFHTPGGKFFGNVKFSKGVIEDFGSGILATILSTPCSAPFLGTALTFAFTAPTYYIFLIFLFIGLGLSFPFLIVAIFPKSISILPKPGPWMDHLKRFLGLAMLLTIVWLYDVFGGIHGSIDLINYLNLFLIFLFFSFHIYKAFKKARFIAYIFFIFSGFCFIFLLHGLNQHSNMGLAKGQELVSPNELHWEDWSPTKVESAIEQKELTFINFTAKWCFTCKVNEKVVFNSNKFKNFVIKNNIKLLKADWTKRDPEIGDWLEQNNLFGIPAYFFIDAEGKKHYLGETISTGEIEALL